jgi:hypothetical protein
MSRASHMPGISGNGPRVGDRRESDRPQTRCATQRPEHRSRHDECNDRFENEKSMAVISNGRHTDTVNASDVFFKCIVAYASIFLFQICSIRRMN